VRTTSLLTSLSPFIVCKRRGSLPIVGESVTETVLAPLVFDFS